MTVENSSRSQLSPYYWPSAARVGLGWLQTLTPQHPTAAPRRRPTPLPSPPRPCIASSDHGSSCTGPGYRVGRCHNVSHALKTMVNYGREYIMQWLTRASLTCVLTWLSAEVQTLTNCSELSLYFSTRLEKRNTVCSNHVNSFPSSKLICIFLHKVLFWNLLTSSA